MRTGAKSWIQPTSYSSSKIWAFIDEIIIFNNSKIDCCFQKNLFFFPPVCLDCQNPPRVFIWLCGMLTLCTEQFLQRWASTLTSGLAFSWTVDCVILFELEDAEDVTNFCGSGLSVALAGASESWVGVSSVFLKRVRGLKIVHTACLSYRLLSQQMEEHWNTVIGCVYPSFLELKVWLLLSESCLVPVLLTFRQ